MSPDQVRIKKLETEVKALRDALDVTFIENIKRRLGL
jgi:hypothetical protein